MKGKTLTFIGVLAALAAVLLILFYKTITTGGVVITGGVLFILVGAINLMIVSRDRTRKSGARILMQIANLGAVVLGVCLLVFVKTFEPYVGIVFGFLVALCALWQFYILAIGLRPITLPAWHYVFPLLLVGGAIYIFTRDAAADMVKRDMIVMLSTGISLAVFAVGCIIEGSSLGVTHRRMRKTSAEAENAGSKPAEIAAEPEHKEAAKTETAPEKATTDDLDAPLKAD